MLIKLCLIVQALLVARNTHATQPPAPACAGYVVAPIAFDDARSGSARAFASRLTVFGVGRGPAILVGMMLTTAAVGSQVTKFTPAELGFLAPFIGQFLALGIYDLSSPYFDPLRSRIRRLGFSLKTQATGPAVERGDLEDQWTRGGNALTNNAQMSRNLNSSFLASALQNFHAARVAQDSGDTELCANQIADVAVRMRNEFPEISPSNESIARAVDAAFASRVKENHGRLKAAIWARILYYDPKAGDPARCQYYEQLLSAWLDFSLENGR